MSANVIFDMKFTSTVTRLILNCEQNASNVSTAKKKNFSIFLARNIARQRDGRSISNRVKKSNDVHHRWR